MKHIFNISPLTVHSKMGWIYLITCTVNGKPYVGETTCKLLCERWKGHTYNGRMYAAVKKDPALKGLIELHAGKSHLYNAMALYGVENFKIEPLLEVNDDDIKQLVIKLGELEIEYIKKYDSVENGYNIESGGRNAVHTDETKKLISQNTKKAFAKIEVVTKMRKHHDKLVGLPVKCTYGMSNNRACYRVRRHPLVKDKCFYVGSYESEEACKQALLRYVIEVQVPKE
jgi:group I intron endonuclease